MNKLSRAGNNGGSKTRSIYEKLVSRQRLFRILMIAAGTLLVLLASFISISPKRYQLTVGMVPNVTIFATKDVVDEVTTQSNRNLAAAAVTPTYKFAEDVTEQVMTNLDNLFVQLSAVRQYAETLPDYGPARQYNKEELEYAAGMLNILTLRDYQLITLMNATATQFDELISSMRSAVRNTMQGHVSQGQENIAINSIMQILGYKTSVGLLQNVVHPVLKAVISPNMVIDQEQTDTAKEEAMKAVEPVVYKQGQSVVVRGEGRIRQNQIDMLRTLGLLNDNEIDYRLYGGAVLIVLCALCAMAAFLWLAFPGILSDIRYLAIIYLSLLLTVLFSFLGKSLQLIYLTPLITGSMLLTLTIGLLPSLPVNLCSALIGSLVLSSSASASPTDLGTLLVSSVLAATLASLILSRRSIQRSPVLQAGAAAAVTGFLSVLGFGLLYSNNTAGFLERALNMGGGIVIATILCIAGQALLEPAFNLPTNDRLMALSNPNHPLLRRLLLEAPGTYHHSILIANMAEASAEAVGANALLARLGGYYHDIGKLKRPHYFKENQIGIGNLHDQTDPAVSAAIITSHIRDGLVLGRQYRLPREILQIVEQHHGNSLVAYFYAKAGEPSDDSSFRYDSIPPQSAEAAIVMLCDTVEAAIRTLNAPTPEEIKAFIWKLIKGKLDTGMLSNSPLTIKDLYTIRDTCATVVHGIFHERIGYPDSDKQSPLAKMRSTFSASRLNPTPVAAPSDAIKSEAK